MLHCSQSTVIQTRVLGLARETLTRDLVDSDLSQRARDLDSDSGPAGLGKGRICCNHRRQNLLGTEACA